MNTKRVKLRVGIDSTLEDIQEVRVLQGTFEMIRVHIMLLEVIKTGTVNGTKMQVDSNYFWGGCKLKYSVAAA